MKTDKFPTNNFSCFLRNSCWCHCHISSFWSGPCNNLFWFDSLVSNQAQKCIEACTIIHKNSEHIFQSSTVTLCLFLNVPECLWTCLLCCIFCFGKTKMRKKRSYDCNLWVLIWLVETCPYFSSHALLCLLYFPHTVQLLQHRLLGL